MNNPGIWLKREYLQGDILDKQLACSACDYTTGHVMSNWKYCPICGTRMFISLEELKKYVNERSSK